MWQPCHFLGRPNKLLSKAIIRHLTKRQRKKEKIRPLDVYFTFLKRTFNKKGKNFLPFLPSCDLHIFPIYERFLLLFSPSADSRFWFLCPPGAKDLKKKKMHSYFWENTREKYWIEQNSVAYIYRSLCFFNPGRWQLNYPNKGFHPD